jgi:hypothetical protein
MIPVRLTLTLLLVFASLPHFGQMAIGLNAGACRTEFSGDPPRGIGYFAPLPGFSSSLQFDYRFSQGFAASLQPGINLLRTKYVVMNDSGTAALDSTHINLTYFSLPLHAVVWSESGRFYVLAGLQLDYTLNTREKVLVSGMPSRTFETRDLNIYAQFGAGFILHLGKSYLSFELRYNQGLADLNSALVHEKSYLPRTKLTNTNLLIGFHVPLGNKDLYQVRRKKR